MQTIEITIGGGKANVETTGFQGEACMKATEPFYAALGGKVEDEKTAEYHQSQTSGQGQRAYE